MHGKDDWHFKEGTTKVVALTAGGAKKPAASGAVKVKGGAAGKRAGKAAAKTAKKTAVASRASDKLKTFVPKKQTPGKGKKSVTTGGAKGLPTPAGKKTADESQKMTMQTFKQFLKVKNAKSSGVLGKRSTGKGKKSAGK